MENFASYDTKNNDRTNRLDPLDAFRVIALLIVFIHHAHIEGVPYIAGGVGVRFFFAISGYQIGKGFKNGRYTPASFLKKRFIHVGIPYLICVIFITLFYSYMIEDDPLTILRMFTFTHTAYVFMGHLWFVSAIMQLYLMAMVVGYVINRVRNNVNVCRIFFVALIIGGCVMRIMYSHTGIDLYFTSYGSLDIFFCAFLLPFINVKKVKISSIIKGIALTTFCIFLLITLLWIYEEVDNTLLIESTLLMSLMFLYIFDDNIRRSNEPLTLQAIKGNWWRIVECLSLISFGFYMWHAIVVKKFGFIKPYPVFLLASFAISILIAVIWYYSVEKMTERMYTKL